MTRRQAIFRITVGGAAITTAAAGYKWYHITKNPNLSYLEYNKELITSLVDTIIPATDIPGAVEAGVPEFVILMVRECTGRKAQNKFINGLTDVQEYCLVKWGRLYQQCSLDQKEKVLSRFEKKGRPFKGIIGKVQNKYLGNSFFTTLKQYTVEGYCTSKLGATQGLSYVFIPSRYQGCIPLANGQKAWAIN